jgi:hypothetical protein
MDSCAANANREHAELIERARRVDAAVALEDIQAAVAAWRQEYDDTICVAEADVERLQREVERAQRVLDTLKAVRTAHMAELTAECEAFSADVHAATSAATAALESEAVDIDAGIEGLMARMETLAHGDARPGAGVACTHVLDGIQSAADRAASCGTVANIDGANTAEPHVLYIPMRFFSDIQDVTEDRAPRRGVVSRSAVIPLTRLHFHPQHIAYPHGPYLPSVRVQVDVDAADKAKLIADGVSRRALRDALVDLGTRTRARACSCGSACEVYPHDVNDKSRNQEICVEWSFHLLHAPGLHPPCDLLHLCGHVVPLPLII